MTEAIPTDLCRACLALIFRVVIAALACLFVSPGTQAQSPACGVEMKNAARAESARYTVAYAPLPAIIEVSQHFSLELVVCAKAGAPTPGALRVGATMPEHGHGMNYRATVKPLGDGRFRADGLLFHMPGRWQFEFDVGGGNGAERLRHDFLLQ